MGTILQMYNMCQHKVYKNKAVSKIKKRHREMAQRLISTCSKKVRTRVSPEIHIKSWLGVAVHLWFSTWVSTTETPQSKLVSETSQTGELCVPPQRRR